jgi:DNA-binding LytR/AlgR family response regulator
MRMQSKRSWSLDLNETENANQLDGSDSDIRAVASLQMKNCPANTDPSFPPADSKGICLQETADEAIDPFWNELRHEPLTVTFAGMETRRPSEVIEPSPEVPVSVKWRSRRIAIKARGRILLIDAADAIAVEAKGIYVSLRDSSTSYLLRESMTTMEKKLNPHGFVRIHRSVLVNAAQVQEIRRTRAGECVVCLQGGKEYTVTRTYKKNLQALAQSWIGMDGFAIP